MGDAAREEILCVSQAAASSGLLWRSWDADLYIVHQPSSAETHVFNGPAAAILRVLDDRPLALDNLKTRVEEALGAQLGDLAEADFHAAVRRLDELGLIERVQTAGEVR
jgi:PqqD family protein of HPr-rel-A system